MKFPNLSLQAHRKIQKNRKVPEITMTSGLEDPNVGLVKNSDIIIQEDPNLINSSNMNKSKQHLTLPEYVPEFISKVPSDDDSVSTIGSTDFIGLNKSGSSRSIFTDYWKIDENLQSPPMQATPSHSSQSSALHASTSNPSGYAESIMNSRDWSSYINEEIIDRQNRKNHSSAGDVKSEYETILKANEAGRTAIPSATILNDGPRTSRMQRSPFISLDPYHSFPVRRKIFNRTYAPKDISSLPSYGYVCDSSPTKRTPPLPFPLTLGGKKLLRSSIRRDRSTSLSEATTLEESYPSTQTRPSVSFERKVTVHEIDKPHEQWVHDGWSERFC